MSFARLRQLPLAVCVLAITGLFAEEPVRAETVKPPDGAGDEKAVKALIEKLNATENLAREEAERDLLKIGQPALPLLKEAAKTGEPEVAARAKRLVSKLTETAVRPAQSYADIMPANSIFFLEAPHTRQTLDKLKDSPLGKFWDLPATQKFYKGHREGVVPNDQTILDAVRAMTKVLEGKALFALGAPDTAEAAELDPPLVYVLESKQPQILEAQVRNLFQGMADAPKASRRYGPFTVEEHITAQSVFGQESIIHALTQKGIESFLDNLLKRPEKTLSGALKDLRALLPDHDFLFHLSADGFKDLAEAGQLLDDDQVETLEKLGAVKGSTAQGVAAATADGFDEYIQLKFGGGDKNEGLFAVMARMAAAVPPAPAAGTPQALDMIPWEAGLLFSLQGSTSAHAAALAKAIREIDAVTIPPPAPVAPVPAVPKPPDAAKPPAPPAVVPTPQGKTAGQAAAAGVVAGAKDEKAEEKAPKPKGKVMYPHVEKIERIGLKLEEFLEQAQGPVQIAFFPHVIEDDVPNDVPLTPLLAMVLKDPKVVEMALEAASAGAEPRFAKEVLNGGVHYVDKEGDEEAKPGFWLKGNYLAFSTERDLLDLASAAAAHAAGNERMADRASYKQAVTQKLLDPGALLTIFGDAEQVVEMPYKLSRLNWEEDAQDNPWPDYELIKPLLQNKPVIVEFKTIPGGVQIHARTPLTLFGLIEIFRRPFIEALIW